MRPSTNVEEDRSQIELDNTNTKSALGEDHYGQCNVPVGLTDVIQVAAFHSTKTKTRLTMSPEPEKDSNRTRTRPCE